MRALLILPIFLCAAGCVTAQVTHGPPPTTPHDCEVAANRLAADEHSAAFAAALLQTRWERCGATGANALASTLLRFRLSTDSSLLDNLLYPASYNRNPAIFAAALEVAADPAASPPARAMALLVAMRQHNVRIDFGRGVGRLASEPLPGLCIPVSVFNATYTSSAPLPADYRAQFHSVAQGIMAAPDSPPGIRALARCGDELVVRGPSYEEATSLVN